MRKIKRFFNNIERWVAYRTYDKYHIVKTGLKPGYYDKDHIMLHANFSILKDFVEHELAGLFHLDWAGNLRYNEDFEEDPNGKLSGQAIAARVYKKCYLFWKDQYTKVPELWQMVVDGKLTGNQAFCIEEFWEELADRRLVQLMRVRRGLWT